MLLSDKGSFDEVSEMTLMNHDDNFLINLKKKKKKQKFVILFSPFFFLLAGQKLVADI